MKTFKNYFLKGLLYTVPIVALCWAIYYAHFYLNGILLPLLIEIFDPSLHQKLQSAQEGTEISIGIWNYLGIIILFTLITLIGYLGSVIIASPINVYFKKLLQKAPLLKTIYSSVKDLMNTFIGNKKGFSEPVLVKIYENSTIERIGFVTSDDISSLGEKQGKVLVYMPHSYAISGQLFVVERKYIKSINQSSAEVMKLIISAGVTKIEE